MPDYYASFFVVLVTACSLFGFNHPEIEWKSVSTKHFVISYYDKTKPALYPTWKIAEETYEAFAQAYNFRSSNKIRLAIADYDDYSNGWADWLSGNIMIWVPDARFEFRGNTTWLRNVITHEIAHILSLHQKRSYQILQTQYQFGIHSKHEHYSFGEPFSFLTLYPAWFTEGIAQLEAAHLGHDCWDSRRDMLLRCAALDNTLLSIDEMGVFNHKSIGNEMVYNQGFSFMHYLENSVGIDKIRSVFRTGSSRKETFNRLFSTYIGFSVNDAYDKWVDSIKTNYKKQIPSNPTKTTAIWGKGYLNTRPRISPDGKWWGWLTNHKDDSYRTDLVIAPYGSGTPVARIHRAHTSWDFASDGRSVYYIKSYSPNHRGSYLNDIYKYDYVAKKNERITYNSRVYDIAASPKGDDLACVLYLDSVFSLALYDLQKKSFTVLKSGEPGNPFMHSSFDPSGTPILAVTKIRNGRSQLFALSLETSELTPLTTGGAQEETPYWADDGRIYYSADYDGIFNVYSVGLEQPDPVRHTNYMGGGFTPCITTDKKIICSEYTSSGYQIALASLETAQWEKPESYACEYEQLPAPKGKIAIRSRPYKPELLRGIWGGTFTGNLFYDKSLLLPETYSSRTTTTAGPVLMVGTGTAAQFQVDALDKRARFFGLNGAILGGPPGWSDRIGEFGSSMEHRPSDRVELEQRAFQKPPGTSFHNPIQGEYSKTVAAGNYRNSRLKQTTEMALRMLAEPEQTDPDSEEDLVEPPLFILAAPYVGWQDQTTSATLGIQFGATLAYLFYPIDLSAQTYAVWHLTRNSYIGIEPGIMTTFSSFGATIPLFWQWQKRGYYNEDINYNYADVTQAQVVAEPSLIPIVYKTESEATLPDGSRDTLDVAHNLFGVQTQTVFTKGFPIFRNSSLIFHSDNSMSFWSNALPESKYWVSKKSWPLGQTPFLGIFDIDLTYTFPLIRTMNKDVGYYWDACYGNIGYGFQLLTDQNGLDVIGQSGFTIFSQFYTSNSLRTEHYFSAGLQIGHYKSFHFFKRLSLQMNYALFRERFYLSVTAR